MQICTIKKNLRLREKSEGLRMQNAMKQELVSTVHQEQDNIINQRRKQLETIKNGRLQRIKRELSEQLDNFENVRWTREEKHMRIQERKALNKKAEEEKQDALREKIAREKNTLD